MIQRILHFFAALVLLQQAIPAQTEFVQYRSTENPYYWKNKKPFADYWQQDVHYNITATLNDSTDVISGTEELTYWNNSPFDLPYVYFHLYNNAQTSDSYLSDLYRNNHYHLSFGKYRKQGLGTQVTDITAGGAPLRTEVDNTIMKVWLPRVLHPGETITFQMDFKTYFDREAIRNRMKMFNSAGKKHYDIVHWYPRIAVVDRRFVWTTDQHMDHEFYGDFGSFHVEMTLPDNYVADGTGILLNEREIMPDSLRRKLDISNFVRQPFNSPPTLNLKRSGTKIWKFSAINVHDFAMTADPNYRISERNWNGTRCIALVQEGHAPGWQNATQNMAKILEVNTYNIGPYPHPKMIVADAQDGMEYPMLTLCGGTDPGYRTLLIHEMTHNWFQGMVGSNETYRAWMDEGLTQFYTADDYQFIDGPISIEVPYNNWYLDKFTVPQRIVDDQIYTPFYASAVTRNEEVILNTHADDFNGGIRHGGGYSQSYTKTAAMLKNLEYVLGRSLFDKSMQHYFSQWSFCHPYPEDFRNSIIRYSGVDLNWFFDEWLETTKHIDYKVGRVRYRGNGQYTIRFKRKGMQMPVDFSVVDRNDSASHYYIPNTWFEKPTGASTLPRWIGWGPKLKTTYTATVNIPNGIKDVIIDPSRRLADLDMTNNSLKHRVNLRFDSKVYNPPDWKNYDLRVRPSLWYNGYDGLKFGFVLGGDYMATKNVFEAAAWFSSGLAQYNLDSTVRKNRFNVISFVVDYKTSTHRWIPRSAVYAQLKSLDGLDAALLGIEKKLNSDRTRLYTHLKAMLRDQPQDMVYLINRGEWGYQKLNSALHAGVDHQYQFRKGTGNLGLHLRAAAFTNDYDFSSASLTNITRRDVGKFTIGIRAFAQAGFGTRLPSESMLYAAGANNEDLMNNKFTRSMGFFPPQWGGYGIVTNHFTAGGGLNLRGYSGYLLPEINKDGGISYQYKGTSGAALNTEIDFGRLLSFMAVKKWNPFIRLQPYLFGDAGIINTNAPGKAYAFSSVMADAGAGITLNILRWWKLYNVKPLTVRFDVPFFVNRQPFAEKDNFQFRWMLAVNRAF